MTHNSLGQHIPGTTFEDEIDTDIVMEPNEEVAIYWIMNPKKSKVDGPFIDWYPHRPGWTILEMNTNVVGTMKKKL